MKKLNLLLCLFLFFLIVSHKVNAQKDSSGVYMTASDFKIKKLSFPINCKTKKHKIKLNSFFNKDYITVIHQGITSKLSKDSVFGFKTCNGYSYRIIRELDYTILNPDDSLLIYEFQPLSVPKNPVLPVYKFSVGSSGQVIDLSISNIKNIFPENHNFHDELETEFSKNSNLLAFDRYHKQYKLVRIFNKYNSK